MHDWLSRFTPGAMYSVLAVSGLSALAGWAAMRWLGRRTPVAATARWRDRRLGFGDRLQVWVGGVLHPGGALVVRAANLAPGQRVVVMAEDGPYCWPAIRDALGEDGSLVVLAPADRFEQTRLWLSRWGWARARVVARRSRSAHNRIDADYLLLTDPRWLGSRAAMHVPTTDVAVGTPVLGVARRPWFARRHAFETALRERHHETLASVAVDPSRCARFALVHAQVARASMERRVRRRARL